MGVWRGVHYVHRKVLFSMRHLYAKADPDINPSLTLPVLVVAGGFMDQEKGFRDLKLRSLGKGHFFSVFICCCSPSPLLSVGFLLVFWILTLLIIKSSQLVDCVGCWFIVIFTVAVVVHALLDLSSMLSL